MKRNENERRGWTIVALSLLIGLLCVIAAGDLAIRLAPTWSLKADMRSRINPDVAYLTPQAEIAFHPLDPAILTPPVWIEEFLTPGHTFPTRLPRPTATPTIPAPAQPSSTPHSTTSPTSTIVYPSPTQTSNAGPTHTPKPSSPTATLPVPGSPTLSVSTSTRTATPTFTATATHTPTRTASATLTITATSTPTASATVTNTPLPQADLQITIDDGATSYEGGISVQYTIVVSNPVGPAGVSNASVTSSFSQNLNNISWTCTASGGAACAASGTGNINDSVNLPLGTFVTYRVNAQVISSPGGDLVSSVQVSAPPAITDTNPGNNQAADTDQLVVASILPYGNIDPVKNGTIEYIPPNSSVTVQFNTPLMVNGHPGYDLVYYELPQGTNPGVFIDCVILQVGDGRNWYTAFNWCDNKNDTNASVNMTTTGSSSEKDNFPIDASLMYDLTGVALELDGYVPGGTYKYFRIVSLSVPPDDGDGVEVDAISILP